MHTSKYNIQNTAKQLLAGRDAQDLVVPQGNKTVWLVGEGGQGQATGAELNTQEFYLVKIIIIPMAPYSALTRRLGSKCIQPGQLGVKAAVNTINSQYDIKCRGEMLLRC